jgi:hypothetical protein
MFSEADQLSFINKNWSAIPRIARTVPFGFQEDPDDPDLLQPVISELQALEVAKKHLIQFSYRDVAAWLTQVTGREISHMGLKKRVDNDNKRRREASTIKKWAEREEKARAKVEAILQRLGETSRGDEEQLSFDFGDRKAS